MASGSLPSRMPRGNEIEAEGLSSDKVRRLTLLRRAGSAVRRPGGMRRCWA